MDAELSTAQSLVGALLGFTAFYGLERLADRSPVGLITCTMPLRPRTGVPFTGLTLHAGLPAVVTAVAE